ncbi:MAG TPA: hypothetical protein VMR41_02375 [Patescibacteria group bacterium]|nr:hypothetical protein [Patescibacteria group bacterium]
MKAIISKYQFAYLSIFIIIILGLGRCFAACDIRTGTYNLGWGCSDAVSCAQSVASGIGAYVVSVTMNGANSFTATFLMKNNSNSSVDCGCLEAQKTVGTFTQQGNLINAGSHDMPQNHTCGDAAFDSTVNPIVGTSCSELGDINPNKPPVINGIPITSGKWVYVTLHRTTNSGGPMSDTSFKTVTSHGCSDISINGLPLSKGNAHDSTYNEDGVVLHACVQDGSVKAGTCSSLGIDTGCGGATSFNYGSNNDSILNTCKFGEPSIDSVDSTKGQVKKTTDTTKGAQSIVNTNGIIDAQNQTTQAVNNGNGILGELKTILTSMAQDIHAIPGFLEKLWTGNDTGGVFDTTQGSPVVHDSGVDTTLGYMHLSDSSRLLNKFHAKMDSIRASDSGDTNIHIDSVVVSHTFDSLRVNWGDTSTSGCPCDSQAFSINFMNKPFYINACIGNIGQYLRPVFKILALLMVFFFFRNTVFKVISQFFTSGWGGRG